jgi:Peptidase family S41
MRLFLCVIYIFLLSACSTTSKNYSPLKKFSKKKLQKDYSLLKNILQKKHPSLYWYTSKDSMDMYFDKYYNAIEDSMTEQQFGWKVLAPLTNKIHCGHTSFGMSKAYNKWVSNKYFPSFPLLLKVWADTMVVMANLNKKDSILKKGTLITSISGIKNATIIDSLFGYMTEDGNANNINYIRLSGSFPYFHRNVMGLKKNYAVEYLDSNNQTKKTLIPLFELTTDTTKKIKSKIKIKIPRPKKPTKQERLLDLRSLKIDTTNNTAIIILNTFNKGKLRKFFRKSFEKIKSLNINNLVIDVRSNGGGKVDLSTLLTKYVSRMPFKIADTVFANTKFINPYNKYISSSFLNNIGLFLSTKKMSDGKYHNRYYEHKMFYPKKKNHFGGQLYVLMNGQTFSASTLFCNAIKGQQGITLVGEEAGGGWHGNSGIMIPDITLPNTHMRVRLPLFRIVQFNHVPKNGLGVMPDIYVSTDYNALINGRDKKMEVVMELIKTKSNTDK